MTTDQVLDLKDEFEQLYGLIEIRHRNDLDRLTLYEREEYINDLQTFADNAVEAAGLAGELARRLEETE